MTTNIKTERHPSQPGNRSTGNHVRPRKPKSILQRFSPFFKHLNMKRIIFLVLAGLAAFSLLHWWLSPSDGSGDMAADPTQPSQMAEEPEEAAEPYIFRDGDGYPINVQHMTDAWATEAGYEKRYELTDAERLEIAQVVTAEAEGEPFAGKVAVAQCILQTCEDEALSPSEALVRYSYSKRRPRPTEEALEAVEDVFDFGHVATSEPIKYFYAPALCESNWHESQVYVLTINGHKFFKERR